MSIFISNVKVKSQPKTERDVVNKVFLDEEVEKINTRIQHVVDNAYKIERDNTIVKADGSGVIIDISGTNIINIDTSRNVVVSSSASTLNVDASGMSVDISGARALNVDLSRNVVVSSEASTLNVDASGMSLDISGANAFNVDLSRNVVVSSEASTLNVDASGMSVDISGANAFNVDLSRNVVVSSEASTLNVDASGMSVDISGANAFNVDLSRNVVVSSEASTLNVDASGVSLDISGIKALNVDVSRNVMVSSEASTLNVDASGVSFDISGARALNVDASRNVVVSSEASTLNIDASGVSVDISGTNAMSVDLSRNVIVSSNVATLNLDASGMSIDISGANAMRVDASSNVHIVNAPTEETHATNKLYVDTYITGLHVKESVYVATTTNLTDIRSITISQMDNVYLADVPKPLRVLVKDQTDKTENGIYLLDASNQLVRSGDFDNIPNTEIAGSFVSVDNGYLNSASQWVCLEPNYDISKNIGEFDINFVKFANNTDNNTFFEFMTKQPRKFIKSTSSDTVDTITINWTKSQVPTYKLTIFDNKTLPITDGICVDIRLKGTNTWQRAAEIGSTELSFSFEIQENYKGFIPVTDSEFDARVYGVNNAEDSETLRNLRAILFEGLQFEQAGAPSQPTVTIDSVGSTIRYTIRTVRVDKNQATSTLFVNRFETSYTPASTNRIGGLTNSNTLQQSNSINPAKNQTNISGGGHSDTLGNLLPGTRYNISSVLRNNANVNDSSNSEIVLSDFTHLPTPHLPNLRLNNVLGAGVIGNSSTTYPQYINRQNSNVKTIDFTNSTIEFECTNPSLDASTNQHYGTRLVDGSTLATLTVTHNNGNGVETPESVAFTKDNVTQIGIPVGAKISETITVTVVNDGGHNKFVFNGDSANTPDFRAGVSYVFDQSDSTNTGHPLRFSLSNSSLTPYNSTASSTAPGNSGATVTFTPDISTTVYAYCIPHGVNMGSYYNEISISEKTSEPIRVTVVNDGGYNKFVFNPVPTFTAGVSYVFNQSDSSNDGHPLRFSLSNSSRTPYNSTASSTAPGNSGATVTFTPDISTTVYAYCIPHGFGMGSYYNSTLTTSNDYIQSVQVYDPYTGQAEKNQGFRKNGRFSLKDLGYNKFSASQHTQTLTYTLTSNIGTFTDITHSFDFDVDDLPRSSNNMSDTAPATATATSVRYNCGIPSVEYFTLAVNDIDLYNLFSEYNHKLGSNVNVATLDVIGHASGTQQLIKTSAIPNDSGSSYTWNVGSIANCHFTNNSSTYQMQCKTFSRYQRAAVQRDSLEIAPKMFCDYSSHNKSGTRITNTSCPDFYQLDASNWTPDTVAITQYDTTHEDAVNSWTPIWHDGKFRKTSSFVYKDFTNTSNFSYPAGTSTHDYSGFNDGTKTIAFRHGGITSGTNLNSVINSYTNILQSTVTEMYINSGNYWGNLSESFNSLNPWFGSATPSSRKDILGAVDGDNEIQVDPSMKVFYLIFVF